MLTDNSEAKRFLMELYKLTSGDPANQVSMYDVGSALGLERDAAGKLAEDLIGNGMAEVKTLSGGIAITPDGLASLEVNAESSASGDGLVLGNDTLVDEPARQALERLLTDIRQGIGTATGYDAVEEMIIDIKTAEVQLLSA